MMRTLQTMTIAVVLRAGCFWLLCLHFVTSRSFSLDDDSIDHLGRQDRSSIDGQLASLQTQMGSVLQRLVSADHRFSALDHSITALYHRVSSLDQRLSALQVALSVDEKWKGEQNDEMQKQVPSPGMNKAEGGERGQQKDAQGEEGLPFRLGQVTKRDLGYVYVVTFLYQSSAVPDVLLKIDSYPVPVRAPKPGVATVYIPKEEETSISPSVYFVFPDHFVSVRLNLTSQPAMDVPYPTLNPASGKDVTFSPGQDAQIEFTFSVEGDMETVEGETAAVQYLTQSAEEKNAVDRFHFFYFNSAYTSSPGHLRLALTSLQGSPSSPLRGTAVLNTAQQQESDPGSILEAFITLHFNCSVNCLVRKMTKQHHVNVYRADRAGPFPEGFIGFVRDDFRQNRTHVQCAPGPHAQPCALLCEAAGDQVMSVDIEKLGGSEDGAELERTRRLSVGRGGYWGTAMLALDNPRVEDAGEYVCIARSEKEKITQRITLVVKDTSED